MIAMLKPGDKVWFSGSRWNKLTIREHVGLKCITTSSGGSREYWNPGDERLHSTRRDAVFHLGKMIHERIADKRSEIVDLEDQLSSINRELDGLAEMETAL